MHGSMNIKSQIKNCADGIISLKIIVYAYSMQGTGKITGKHEEKRRFGDIDLDGANIKINLQK
jgi:hypothetical protein